MIKADPKMLNAVRAGKASASAVDFGSNAAKPATTMNEPKMATPPSLGTDVV
jgi:hypothetical protein